MDESLNAARVEALCGKKHAHRNGDQRHQQAGISELLDKRSRLEPLESGTKHRRIMYSTVGAQINSTDWSGCLIHTLFRMHNKDVRGNRHDALLGISRHRAVPQAQTLA